MRNVLMLVSATDRHTLAGGTVMNLQVPQKARNLLTGYTTVSSSRWTPLHACSQQSIDTDTTPLLTVARASAAASRVLLSGCQDAGLSCETKVSGEAGRVQLVTCVTAIQSQEEKCAEIS
jgi:hypothetical protein